MAWVIAAGLVTLALLIGFLTVRRQMHKEELHRVSVVSQERIACQEREEARQEARTRKVVVGTEVGTETEEFQPVVP